MKKIHVYQTDLSSFKRKANSLGKETDKQIDPHILFYHTISLAVSPQMLPAQQLSVHWLDSRPELRDPLVSPTYNLRLLNTLIKVMQNRTDTKPDNLFCQMKWQEDGFSLVFGPINNQIKPLRCCRKNSNRDLGPVHHPAPGSQIY